MLCSNLCALMFKFMRPVMTSVGSYFPLAIQLGKKSKRFEIMKLFLIHSHKLTEYGQE